MAHRGCGTTVHQRPCQQVTVELSDRLTDEHRAAITRWRHHLGAIVAYEVPKAS